MKDEFLMELMRTNSGKYTRHCPRCNKIYTPAEEMTIEAVRFNIWVCNDCFQKDKLEIKLRNEYEQADSY